MSVTIPSLRPAIAVPGWAKNELWRKAQAVPSLDLRFADNKSLVDATTGQNLVTFSRASSATYVDSQGVIRTALNNEPRFDHNPTTGESLGLLVEEARTNLLLNSGTLSTQNVTVTAVAHTLSFTGTGTITLSGTSTAGPLVGTGTGEANRVSLTFTPTAGTLTLTVSGTVTDAQLEIGGFRTSYIPTTGTAATRAADIASITGTNFSSWYRQSEGSFYAAFRSVGNGTNRYILDAQTAGSTSNRIDININTSNAINPRTVVSGAAVSSIAGGTYTAPNDARIAYAYKVTNYGSSFNGGTAVADATAGALPLSIAEMYIGSLQTGSAINGHIRRLTFWPQRLSNSTLQSITQ